jgi:hypothetical protein
VSSWFARTYDAGTQPSAPFSTLNGMSEGLDRVKQAAANRQAAEQELRQAIIEAVKEHSIRQVAAAAGLGPTRIHQIKEEG